MLRSLFIFMVCMSNAVYAAPERLTGPDFSLEIDRALDSIVPNHDLVGFSVTLKPGPNGSFEPMGLRLKLIAPKPMALLSTDFPHIEGSTLLESTLEVTSGVVSWQQVLPIRGGYSLEVSAQAHDGQVKQHIFDFYVTENPHKKKNLAYFLLGLGAFAGLSGWALARGRNRKLGSAYGITEALGFILILLAPVFSSYSKAFAHGHEETKPQLQVEAPKGAAGERLELHLITEHPRVGALAGIKGSFYNEAGKLQPARFSLSFYQLEHQHIVFQTETTSSNGTFEWHQQLFDGSPHRVTLKAWPLNSNAPSNPLEQSIETEVEALQPPWQATAKSFGLLMVFSTLCLGAGFIAGTSRAPREAVSL